MGHRYRAAVSLVLAALLLAAMPYAHAADASTESEFVSRINAARRARGLGALSIRSDLVAVARRHSERQASDGRIYHNPNLRSEVDGWKTVAENVARGKVVKRIHDELMGSAYHRENILWPSVTEIGVGVVWRGDLMYVTQIFREPVGSSRPAPAPQPRSTSGAPAPAVAGSSDPAPSPELPSRTVDMLVELASI